MSLTACANSGTGRAAKRLSEQGILSQELAYANRPTRLTILIRGLGADKDGYPFVSSEAHWENDGIRVAIDMKNRMTMRRSETNFGSGTTLPVSPTGH